mgnify:CR=1 FL=1
MTDINKQIEEALKVKVKNCNNSTTIFDTRDYVLLEDAINIVKNSSRWRKVSEELPEYGSIIVAKGDTSDFQDMYLIEIDSEYSMSVLTSYYKEWKPIG